MAELKRDSIVNKKPAECKKGTSQKNPGKKPSERHPGKKPSERHPGKKPSERHPGKKPSERHPGKKQTLWSYYCDGDVAVPEICVYSLDNCCVQEESGCSRLHAKGPWWWQLQGDTWYNFPVLQARQLEFAFLDVRKNEVELIPVYPAKMGKSGKILGDVLGNGKWKANFESMTIVKTNGLKTLQIRRLSTPSAVVYDSEKATVFEWFFKDKKNDWKSFKSKEFSSWITSDVIEQHYLKDQTSQIMISVAECSYQLDLQSMILKNLEIGDECWLRRRPSRKHHVSERMSVKPKEAQMSLKPKEVQTSLKPKEVQTSLKPKEVQTPLKPKVQTSMKPNEVQTSLKPKEVQVSLKTKDLQTSLEDELLSSWAPMEGEVMQQITLENTSKEYECVETHILKVLRRGKIVMIKRIQNPLLWKAFQKKRAYLSGLYGESTDLNIQMLIHATKSKYIDKICRENFSYKSQCTTAAHAYGRGVYFSNSPEFLHGAISADDTGRHFLVLAQVIIGKVVRGYSTLVRAPDIPYTDRTYDTTVDDTATPRVFVKYNSGDCYPQYVIEFLS